MYYIMMTLYATCKCYHHYTSFICACLVPLILKDALQVTSQSIEGEMAKTLKMVYQLTGSL